MTRKSKNNTKGAREAAEKQLVQEFFEFKHNGNFVDVGANNPVAPESQSFHLEKDFNWSGVLVEPNPKFADICKNLRPNSVTYSCAVVSSEDEDTVTLFIPLLDENEMDVHAAIGKNIDDFNYSEYKEIVVPGKTLNTILEETNIDKIDLLSIDVEGAELQVLLGFNISKYQPKLILLEDKHLYLTKHKFLKNKGYHLVKRTGFNFWYIPVNAKRPYQSNFEKIKILKRMYISRWWKKLKFSIKHKSLAPFKRL